MSRIRTVFEAWVLIEMYTLLLLLVFSPDIMYHIITLLLSYTLGTPNKKLAVIVLPGITISIWIHSLARHLDFEIGYDFGVSDFFPDQQGTTSFPATQQRWLVQRLDGPILKLGTL